MSRKFLVPVVLPADPTAALEAATKQYVDAKQEVAVQTADPGATFDLWYDTDAVSAAIPNVPNGGAAGTVLRKKSITDYDMEWSTPVTPPTTFATPGGVYGTGPVTVDVLDVILGLAAYPCVMEVSVAFTFGFGGACEVNPRLYMYQGNTNRAIGQNIPVAAAKWATAALTWAWAVPLNGQLSFRLQSVIATSGQGCYTECFGTWRRYPT